MLTILTYRPPPLPSPPICPRYEFTIAYFPTNQYQRTHTRTTPGGTAAPFITGAGPWVLVIRPLLWPSPTLTRYSPFVMARAQLDVALREVASSTLSVRRIAKGGPSVTCRSRALLGSSY